MKTKTHILKTGSLSIMFVLFFSTNIIAQDVVFYANANKKAKTGEPFIIQYQLKAAVKGKNFIPPNTSDLNILNINISSSTQILRINKQKSKSYTFTWALTVTSNKKGKLVIPPAQVTVNGKTYKSNTLEIYLEKGTSSNNPQNNPNNNHVNQVNKDIFLSLRTDKTEAYIGEPIYTYTQLYSRYNVNLSEFNPSSMDNFWIQELPMPSSVKAEYTTLNGKEYLTAVLEKKLIFPQKTGEINIEPYNAVFQLYDSWGFPIGNKKVISNKTKIKVKPLPQNKPEGFTGAIGQFSVSLESDVSEIDIDQAVTLTLKISGLGNFGLFDNPEIIVPKTFETMLPQTETNTKVTNSGIEGNKKIVFTYIPRVPGNYTIKGVTFSYFDPKTKKYVTQITEPIKIKIKGDSTLVKDNSIVPIEDGNDIRFIKTSTKLKTQNNFIFGKTKFWLSYIIPLLAFITSIFVMRKKVKENANVELVKSKKADKISTKRLKTASENLKQGNLDVFYDEINKALWGYISDKLSIPISELTRQTVVQTLTNHNVEEQLINDFIQTIDNAETAKYAPTATGFSPENIYQKASEIISTFEKKIHLFKVKK